jgi:predicted RecB family nuclease
MKNGIINTKVVVAFTHCSRKAFLLLFSEDKGKDHQYIHILEKQTGINRKRYLDALKRDNIGISFYDPNNIEKNSDLLIEATLKAHDFDAYCDVLKKVPNSSSRGRHSYEPTIVIGTHTIMDEHKIELTFAGYVLGYLQNGLPAGGTIIDGNGHVHRVKLDNIYKKFRPIIKTLKEWIAISSPEPPPVILNRHCPYCQFRDECRKRAEEDDDLSLLDRMTPKLIQRYHKKGIFTLTQLSYLFKPRRKRKRTKKANLHFNLELQALAIRTEKIYIQELPDIPRHHVELFLDIEGIPDQNFYYLIGLLICNSNTNSYYYFWASTISDEERIWKDFLKKVNEYPKAPIYHYGSYELKAIDKLTKRYNTSDMIKERLTNINSFIYGKVYFPTKSNNLKDLGKYIGASWTASDASGLQSLVWRHRWEGTRNENFQQMLLTYNEEDCRALRLLTDSLTKIKEGANSQENIDFANKPKQISTEIGEQIHSNFETILKFAHANYLDFVRLVKVNKYLLNIATPIALIRSTSLSHFL